MANECSIKHFEDRDKCTAYFANYRSCMEFWASEKLQKLKLENSSLTLKFYLSDKY